MTYFFNCFLIGDKLLSLYFENQSKSLGAYNLFVFFAVLLSVRVVSCFLNKLVYFEKDVENISLELIEETQFFLYLRKYLNKAKLRVFFIFILVLLFSGVVEFYLVLFVFLFPESSKLATLFTLICFVLYLIYDIVLSLVIAALRKKSTENEHQTLFGISNYLEEKL